jgi:hypothetical protein
MIMAFAPSDIIGDQGGLTTGEKVKMARWNVHYM